MVHRIKGEDVEVGPNTLLVLESKNGRHRKIPLNQELRRTLETLTVESDDEEFVFSLARNNVSKSTLRDGFAEACEAAGIKHGSTIAGGIVLA